jgi:hypothetical protein
MNRNYDAVSGNRLLGFSKDDVALIMGQGTADSILPCSLYDVLGAYLILYLPNQEVSMVSRCIFTCAYNGLIRIILVLS